MNMNTISNHPVLSLLNSSENNHDIDPLSDLPYLFIDGSYFCFYCYFSVERWWKISFPSDLETLNNPIQNPLFIEKFKNKCKKIFESLPVNLGIILDQDRKPLIYVGKDKVENEDLIKFGWPEDIWFHADDHSSAHVYLRLLDGESFENIPIEVLEDCC